MNLLESRCAKKADWEVASLADYVGVYDCGSRSRYRTGQPQFDRVDCSLSEATLKSNLSAMSRFKGVAEG